MDATNAWVTSRSVSLVQSIAVQEYIDAHMRIIMLIFYITCMPPYLRILSILQLPSPNMEFIYSQYPLANSFLT